MVKLNLGCGSNKLEGYINVDKYGEPDLKHDLEVFPWPWGDNTVDEIKLIHVLEHLGQQTDIYLGIIKEIYRVCKPYAEIYIVVPHYRHQFFFDDPTHVRAITPMGLELFSKKSNRLWIEKGAANSPLGLYLDVDFETTRIEIKPSEDWFRMFPEQKDNVDFLNQQSKIYNNLIEQYSFTLRVIKS